MISLLDLVELLERMGLKIPGEILAVLAISMIAGVLGLHVDSVENNIMSGEWNVAVASFTNSEEHALTSRDSKLIGLQFFNRLQQEINQVGNNKDLIVEIWGPDDVPAVRGSTLDERATSAEEIANQINADILIYGATEQIGSTVFLLPEIYVRVDNFYELDELVGHHSLGSAIPLVGSLANLPTQVRLNQELADRTRVISLVAQGLHFFSYHDYDLALEKFRGANFQEYWETNQGRETLYLFIGNSSGRALRLNEAEEAYSKAISIAPEYSRAYVGLAGIKYVLAVEQASEEVFVPDFELLEEASILYSRALTASIKPETADIRAKVAFGMGQINLAKWFAGDDTLGLALDYFQQVLDDYTIIENSSGADFDKPNFLCFVPSYNYRFDLELPELGFIEAELPSPSTWFLDWNETELPMGNSQSNKEQCGNEKNQRIAELAAETYARFGLIERQLNRLEQSIFHFELAAKISTSPSRKGLYWSTLAELYASQGQKEQAQRANLECIGQYSSSVLLTQSIETKASYLFALSKCYLGSGDLDEAKSQLQAAIRLLPEHSPDVIEYQIVLDDLETNP